MDIEWVIYHLTHNDDEDFTSIADLDIDLCRSDQDQWDRFLTGLRRNRTVRTIELSRGYQLPVVNDDDLLRLFRALRRIPTLSRVKLHSFTTFDLDQSHPLFEDNTTIEEVWIENGNCYRDDTGDNSYDDDDDDDDDDDLNDDTVGGVDGDECYNQYERFLGFLSSMKRLRQLRIEMPSILSRAVPLAPLLMVSPKLESLVLETSTGLVFSSAVSTSTRRARVGNEWQQQNFGAAMIALRSNKVLRVLDTDFLISFSDFRHVASMLRHNTTLTELCLRLDPSTAMARCRGGDGSGNSNGNNNDRNDRREFHCHFQDSIRQFFEALKTNTSSALRRFKQYNFEDPAFLFSQPKPNEETNSSSSSNNQEYAAIALDLVDICFDMLERNLSLEEFSFFLIDQRDNRPVTETNSREKKELFLRLNQRGRKTVHHRDRRERVSRACFVGQLAKHTADRDLNGVYYYIRSNPSICKTTTTTTTTTPSHEDACRRSAAEKTICEESGIAWKKQKVEPME